MSGKYRRGLLISFAVDEKPVAIALPSPARPLPPGDRGYLPNSPSFRDGVALGPFLQAPSGGAVTSAATATLCLWRGHRRRATGSLNARQSLGGQKVCGVTLGYLRHRPWQVRRSEGWLFQTRQPRVSRLSLHRNKRCPDIMAGMEHRYRAVIREYKEISGLPERGGLTPTTYSR